ncbi:MAG: hypothetical protein ACT4N5_02165 [Nitrosopumilaceae archaeon]
MQRSLQGRAFSTICNKDRKIAGVDLIVTHKNFASMFKVIMFTLMVFFLILYTSDSYAQQPRLATFHETAQVVIDQKFQNQTSASISVLSTSNQEILVPIELDEKIHSFKNVTAVVITNEDSCVLGVIDKTCVLINISRDGFSGGIAEAQDKGREIGDALINDINRSFNIDAEFHSVFIHVDDKINRELETTGVISGRGTVSAVYTFERYDTSFLFEGLSTLLIPKEIRNSGGFLDVAKIIANDPASSMTFSIIPKTGSSLFQLQVSRDQKITKEITSIDTLQFFDVESLERSKYFSSGFYPLNSLVQVVVLSPEPIKVTKHGSQNVPTIEKDGETYPSDLTQNGWFFDPDSGETIIGKYLFGQTSKASDNELMVTIGDLSESIVVNQPDNSFYILIGIGIAAAVAIAWYMKNIKTKS